MLIDLLSIPYTLPSAPCPDPYGAIPAGRLTGYLERGFAYHDSSDWGYVCINFCRDKPVVPGARQLYIKPRTSELLATISSKSVVPLVLAEQDGSPEGYFRDT